MSSSSSTCAPLWVKSPVWSTSSSWLYPAHTATNNAARVRAPPVYPSFWLCLISSPQQLSDSTSYRPSGTAPSTYDASSRVSATGSSFSSRRYQAGGLLHSHTAATNPTYRAATTNVAAAAAAAATTVTVPRWSASVKSARYGSACWLPAVWHSCNDQHQLWKREHHSVSHSLSTLIMPLSAVSGHWNSCWCIWVM